MEPASTDIPAAVLAPATAWMSAPDAAASHDAVPLPALLGSAALDDAFARAAARGGPDACRRAGASVWSKSLLSALLVVPALHALGGQAYETAPRLVVRAGRPSALVAAPPGRWDDADPPALARWMTRIVAPTVDRLAESASLAPRVFWSNAATMIAWLYERWSAVPESATRAHLLAEPILFAPTWPDGAPNPLHRHIDYVPCAVPGYEHGTRRRRLCCLRDRLGQALCAGCPKIEPAARDALLAAAARD